MTDYPRRKNNSLTGQRNSGDMTRMSIDVTLDEKQEYQLEAIAHDLTLRGYFFHCWRTSQKLERDNQA